MIASRELVNVTTGEVTRVGFLPYKRFRFQWKSAVLRHLVRKKMLTSKEAAEFRGRYSNGFHVYFQPVTGSENDVLFRTAEYLATGFFSQQPDFICGPQKTPYYIQIQELDGSGNPEKAFRHNYTGYIRVHGPDAVLPARPSPEVDPILRSVRLSSQEIQKRKTESAVYTIVTP